MILTSFQALRPKIIEYKQYLMLGAIVCGLLIIATILILLDNKNSENPQSTISIQSTDKRIELSKITNGVKANDKWLQKAENDLKEFNKNVEIQEIQKQELLLRVEELEKIVKNYEDQNINSNVDVFAEELNKLREEVDIYKEKNRVITSNLNDVEEIGSDLQEVRKIQNYELKLTKDAAEMHTYNLYNYIAPGSYVAAVVISGVDASVGVNAQSEPRPMLFRIVDKAKNAAFKDKVQEADIIGCIVTGAASGDLSSERVFTRLLKMTCSRDGGKVFETEVHGYAASVGKAGIRGDVVSREGDFVFKSFLAGLASTAGNGITQKFTAPMALTGAMPQSSIGDMVSTSVGGGIANSSSRLSDYLIQRAEQYQPVISVPAGIEVELIFNDGVYLDGGNNSKIEDRTDEIQ